MNVMIFGATGMVGHGVLRECLLAADVALVLTVGRTAVSQTNSKLLQVVKSDPCALNDSAADVSGFDACFFCLGVSSAGMSEAQYTSLTYDMTVKAALTLARLNPQMTFVYVSGAGTDSTERRGSMWARVKGKTENALLRLPFKTAYMFRPGFIQPVHGARSKTPAYRIFYGLITPLLGLTRRLFPNAVVSTEIIGLAMLEAARHGAPKAVLEASDINALVRDSSRASA